MDDSAVWVQSVYADVNTGLYWCFTAPFLVLHSHVHTHLHTHTKSLAQTG